MFVFGNVLCIVTVVTVCLGKFLCISSVRFVISCSLFDVREKRLRIVRMIEFGDFSSGKSPNNLGSMSYDSL